MSRVARIVPAENDVLCEACGYTLNGLATSGNCPECGTPIAHSTFEDRRELPAWERGDRRTQRRFLITTAHVVFRPTNFFRTLATRVEGSGSERFAMLHDIAASLLFALAGTIHLSWYVREIVGRPVRFPFEPFAGVVLWVATYLALEGVTRLAAKLTAWEAAYRGIRLPYPGVLRAMHYHAAHYLPVALVACLTIGTYQVMWQTGAVSAFTATSYLYILSAEVILGAIYLFQTYWIAMRNTMYANR
jgi:hypothetical protein